MKITEEQAKMLVDLSTVIELKLGYKIGYTHPCGSFTSPEDDFVLFDILTEEDAQYLGLSDRAEEPQLVAREDQTRQTFDVDFTIADEKGSREAAMPIGVSECPNEFCLHDDKVEAFLKEIDEALVSGKIFFDPEIERKVGHKLYTIKKQADGRFNVRVLDPEDASETGFTRTIKELESNSSLDIYGYYAQALELIKEEWPEAFQEISKK